jgi:outer membrane lipoprotein-sorting protein
LRGLIVRGGAYGLRETGPRGGGVCRIVGCRVRMTLLTVLSGCIPPLIPLQAQDARALAIMEEAGARYRTIDTFCASFDQTLEVPLLGETHNSSGELCQARPDLFAMRWSDPEGDMVVADGEYFWVYYPSADPGQVLQFSMAVRPGGLDFHREFLEAPAEKYRLSYEGTESLDGHATDVISARPLEPAGFREARLWLDRDRSLIRRIRIGMENGSIRTLTLGAIDLDPPPDPDRFKFTPPPGAQVIRRD